MIKNSSFSVRYYNYKNDLIKIIKRKKRKQNFLEVEMLKLEMAKLMLFDNFDVIYSKNDNIGEFQFKFNNNKNIIYMPYTGGAKIFKYEDIIEAKIVPNYSERSYTETTTRKKGGLTRAVVGGSLLGSTGALLGAGTAKSKSKSHTTHYQTYSSYNFEIWLSEEEGYVQSDIPADGFFDKRPPKELEELLYYFNYKIKNNVPKIKNIDIEENIKSNLETLDKLIESGKIFEKDELPKDFKYNLFMYNFLKGLLIFLIVFFTLFFIFLFFYT